MLMKMGGCVDLFSYQYPAARCGWDGHKTVLRIVASVCMVEPR